MELKLSTDGDQKHDKFLSFLCFPSIVEVTRAIIGILIFCYDGVKTLDNCFEGPKSWTLKITATQSKLSEFNFFDNWF